MKTYIFGTSRFAELMYYYEKQIFNRTIDAFTVEKQFYVDPNNLPKPIIPFEEILLEKEEKSILIAIGYNKMNGIRRKIFTISKQHGFQILSFIHPSAIIADNVEFDEGNIVLENTVIQPYVKIGKGNIFWANSTISHHCIIGNFNFFGACCTLSGRVTVSDNCFFGSNCTVRNAIDIAENTLIGAGTYINKSTKKDEVYSEMGSRRSDKESFRYLEIK